MWYKKPQYYNNMGVVVTGATCSSSIPTPESPDGWFYYKLGDTNGSPTAKMVGITNYIVAVDDFTDAFRDIANKTLDVFRLKMVWKKDIAPPSGTSGYLASSNSPLLTGDSRLRYVYSEKDYVANKNSEPSQQDLKLVFLPDPNDRTKFMLYDPMPLGVSSSGYLDKSSVKNRIFIASATAATITNASAIKPMFLIKQTQSDNKREYLDSTGRPYDVNQPLANLSKIRAWNFNVTIKTDNTGYIINVTGLPTGISRVNDANILNTSGVNELDTTSSITLTYNIGGTAQNYTYVPIQTLTADSEVINAGDNEYKILYQNSPMPLNTGYSQNSVMGWSTASPPAFKLYKTYYSILNEGSSNGLKLGFFNLLPLTRETSSTALRYFMLLTSINSHYITLGASNTITFTGATSDLQNISTARSTQTDTSTVLGSLYTYGGWTFTNIDVNNTFCLMYTPPYSITGVKTSTSTGMITSTMAEATNTKVYYLTFTTTGDGTYGSTEVTLSGSTAPTAPATAARFICADCTPNSDGICFPAT